MKKIKLFTAFILCSMFLISCTSDSNTPDPLYDIVPDVSGCVSGSLSKIEKQKVLAYINSIRTTHNLPHLKYYDSINDKIVQNAALFGAANGNVSCNDISDTDECYDAGSTGVSKVCVDGSRSLWGSEKPDWTSSEFHVNEWISELNSDNVDNRRRLLNPFLKTIAFGRVIGTPKRGDFKFVSSATLLFTDGNIDLSESDISFVACPYGNYNAKLFDPNSFLSFSVLCDKTSKTKNGASAVSFSGATIEVSAGTQSLEIVRDSVTSDNYNNAGLPNSLKWKVEGLTKNVAYTVRIHDVIIIRYDGTDAREEVKDYEYTFSFK
jgi:hypothetical protein